MTTQPDKGMSRIKSGGQNLTANAAWWPWHTLWQSRETFFHVPLKKSGLILGGKLMHCYAYFIVVITNSLWKSRVLASYNTSNKNENTPSFTIVIHRCLRVHYDLNLKGHFHNRFSFKLSYHNTMCSWLHRALIYSLRVHRA